MLQIKTTTDHSVFNIIGGNREINPQNLARIENSISEQYIPTVLIVNENMDIIDGQHRFKVLEKKGLPVTYLKVAGLELKHVKLLNTAGKGWNDTDFLISERDLGNEEYGRILDFMEVHHLPTNAIKMLLSGNKSLGNEFSILWRSGNFICRGWEEAESDAMTLKAFEGQLSKWKSMSWIKAILTIIWEYSAVDMARLQRAVYHNADELVRSNGELAYRQKLSEFYNRGYGKANRMFFFKKEEMSFA